jgi:hypothetical protein
MLTTRTIVMLVSFTTLALLHGLGTFFSLYWHIAWYDSAMHFFGGVIVALGIYTMADISFPVPAIVFRLAAFMAVVLSVVVLWEIFELWAGVPVEDDFFFDTAVDMILGLFGGFLGFHLGKRLGTL